MGVVSLKVPKMGMPSSKAVSKLRVLLQLHHGSCRHPIMVEIRTRTVARFAAASCQNRLCASRLLLSCPVGFKSLVTGGVGDPTGAFFVLESGNGVRSANLRYYGGDPADGAAEHTNKGIIMWDAAEVTGTETSHEQACFELKHHYRGRTQSWLWRGTTYTICITREEYPQGNINELRDEWVNNLQQTLVWHPRVA